MALSFQGEVGPSYPGVVLAYREVVVLFLGNRVVVVLGEKGEGA